MRERSARAVKAGVTTARLAALLALMAFAFQSYLVQTHIHDTWYVKATTGYSTVAQPGPTGPNPLDPANCPICQEILHAGTYVAPMPVILLLAESWVVFHTPSTDIPALPTPPDRGWNSRAPPRI